MIDLFEDEKPVLKKKLILHKKKSPVTAIPEPIILHKKVPYHDEIHILLGATTNRMFLEKKLYMEINIISELLIKVSKEQDRKVGSIVGYAKVILENMPNLFVTQAIEFAVAGESWTHFKNTF